MATYEEDPHRSRIQRRRTTARRAYNRAPLQPLAEVRMMSRVGLLAVVTTIGIASIATRPVFAAPGEDPEEPGARTPVEDATTAPPAAAVAAVSEPVVPRRPRGDQVWGVGVRARYVSVPSWLLGQFTKHNMPLGTFGHFGIEGFRRG